MEEKRKREELLSEAFLDEVTGGTPGASTSPNPGSFLHCSECRTRTGVYSHYIDWRDRYQTDVNDAVRQGEYALADLHLAKSHKRDQWAQEEYAKMKAHGHPDFPAALRGQRLGYNPPN
jgi:hypothetical protein